MKKAASEWMLTLLLVSTLTVAFIILRAEAIDPPATEWSRIYDGAGDGEALSLVQTSDGGYAIAGYTLPVGAVFSDFWLIKVDSSGSEEWNKTYGGTGDEEALSLVQTSDGGYALAGNTNSFGAGDWDFWLVKTDSSGNMQWNRTYGGAEFDLAMSVVATSDGGYALAGTTASFGAGGCDAWLVKVDPTGNMEWSKTYGGKDSEWEGSLVNTNDGGYALTGTEYFSETQDAWLVKTDAGGNMQWNQTYDGASRDGTGSVVQTFEGGYAIAGFTESYGAGGKDFWLVKTDTVGNVQWNRTYGGTGDEGAKSVVQTSDGGYALVGNTNSFGAGGWDFWLVKVNPSGNMEWNRTYGGTGSERVHSFVQTSDGGYALAGTTASGAGGWDAWLVKVAGPPQVVGGVYIPANKLELFAPYIGLTTLLAVAVASVVYVKKRKMRRAREKVSS